MVILDRAAHGFDRSFHQVQLTCILGEAGRGGELPGGLLDQKVIRAKMMIVRAAKEISRLPPLTRLFSSTRSRRIERVGSLDHQLLRTKGRRDAESIVVHERQDPRGRAYYWIGFRKMSGRPPKNTDLGVVQAGGISVTPLQLDLTHEGARRGLRAAIK